MTTLYKDDIDSRKNDTQFKHLHKHDLNARRCPFQFLRINLLAILVNTNDSKFFISLILILLLKPV